MKEQHKKISKSISKPDLKAKPVSELIQSNCIFFNQGAYLTYSPLYGLSIYKKNLNTEFIRDNATIFFRLIESLKISYGIFAGNAVGYVRNKANMPWVDDYDIMVFGSDIETANNLNKNIIFRKNGFIAKEAHFGLFIYNEFVCDKASPFFQCDIFFSDINNKNIVVNKFGSGLYHNKMPKDVVLPFKKITIDSMEVYGLKDPETEVKLCYGDVSKGVLYSHNPRKNIKTDDWRTLDDFFKNKIKEGTSNVLNNLNSITGDKKINIVNNRYTDFVSVLKAVAAMGANVLNVFDQEFFEKYAYDIKFYLPEITINYYHTTTYIIPAIFLNKCDNVYFKHKALMQYYDSAFMFYIKKPIMDTINLITFGTFDLFHEGHKNIFDKCEKYSENIVVGLSSDKFTYEKKKIYPTDNFEVRKQNISFYSKYVNEVFSEEKMELKNEYIKNRSGNLLIMGDDWEGRFDYVDCAVIYEKRTPHISSTILRAKQSAAANL